MEPSQLCRQEGQTLQLQECGSQTLEQASETPGGLVKTQIPGPSPPPQSLIQEMRVEPENLHF